MISLKRSAQRIFALLLSAVMLLAMFGCSKDEEHKRPLNIWVYSEEYRDQLLTSFESDFPAINWRPVFTVVDAADIEAKLAAALESGEGLPDIFMLSPDNLHEFVESDATLDLSARGIRLDKSSYYAYTIDAATDSRGALKALCWQPDPGLFFYRRSIAKAYLGTDDPAEIQEQLGTWDGYLTVARTLHEQSRGRTYMTAGIDDMLRAYMAADTQGWVSPDGKLSVSTNAAQFLELAEKMADEGLIYNADQWSAAWSAGISDPQSIFGYFSSGIGMRSVLKKACGGSVSGEGSFGDWAAIKGPQSYNWGGCWFAICSKSKMVSEAETFLRYFTTEDEAICKNCLITGNFSASKTAVEQIKYDPQFYESFLSGQNYYALLADSASSISMAGNSEYSSVINSAFADCVKSCAFGSKTRATALSDFSRTVQEAYPELF